MSAEISLAEGRTPTAEPRGRRPAGSALPWWGWGLAAAAVVSLPVLGGLLAMLRRPQWPGLDQAIISWRAYDVFSGSSPALGQLTQVCRVEGRPVFSPGPLLYWLLAVPVHLDPRTGALVGGALLLVLAAGTACLAAARTGGAGAAGVVAAGLLVLVWNTVHTLGTDPVWNPNAALVPFAALLVVAWTVGVGRLSWLPVLLLLGSFCLQAHLMYAPATAALFVAAPPAGLFLARRTGVRHRGRRVLAGSVAALVVCWAVPLGQQLTSSPGNLRLLVAGTFAGDTRTRGLRAGLRNLAAAIGPDPVWLHRPAEPSYFSVASAPAGRALVVLVLLLAVLGIAARRRSWFLAVAAGVVLLADLGAAVALGGISGAGVLSVVYAQLVLWPVGIGTWCVLGCAAVRAAVALAQRSSGTRPVPVRPAVVRVAAVLLLVIAGGQAVWQHSAVASLVERRGSGTDPAIGALAQSVVRRLPSSVRTAPLAVALPATRHPAQDFDPGLLYAIGYRLRVRDGRPVVADATRWAWNLSPRYWPRGSEPVLVVRAGTGPDGLAVDVVPPERTAGAPAVLTSPRLGDPWVRGGSCG